MSQAPAMPQATPPAVNLRPRTPHFSQEAVQQFRAGLANEQQQQQQVSPLPPQQTQVQNTTGMPPQATPPAAPPQQTQTAPPAQNMQYVPPQYMTQAQINESYRQAYDQHYGQVYQQQADEIAALKAELEAARKLQDDLQAARDSKEIDDLLAQHGQEFASIDPNDAKKLLTPIIQGVRTQAQKNMQQAEARIQTLEKQVNDRFQQMDQQTQYAIVSQVRDKLIKAHPDLEQLQQTEAYRKAMLTPVGGNSGILTGQLVASEYMRGNADYIIGVLNDIKKNMTPDLTNIAGVSSSNVGTQAAAPESNANRLTPEQLAEYRFQRQSGKISAEQYREIMKKHREAQR